MATIPTYTFTLKPRPTVPSQQNNFGNMQRDGSRMALSDTTANGIQTSDASATPKLSPLALTTATTALQIPLNAVAIVICGSAAVSVSENPTIATSSFSVPANTPLTIPLANQLFLYVTTPSTANLSFYFEII